MGGTSVGFNVTMTEAATAYGFTDFAESVDYTPVFGTTVSTSVSWGADGLAVGQFGTVEVGFSTGLTVTVGLSRSGFDTLAIQQFAVKGVRGEALVTYTGIVTVNANNVVAALQDSYLLAGNDTVAGNSANNLLQGYRGNDRVDGAGGTDTAVFSGRMSAYDWSRSGTSINTSGPDGFDALLNVERLKFDDFSIAFDIDGVAGQATGSTRRRSTASPTSPA